MKNYIGYTIAEAKANIKAKEGNKSFYQVYTIEKQTITKNFFKCFKKHHLRNKEGKRIYYIQTNTYYIYADDESKESNNFIIDSFIEKGKHSYFSLNGQASADYEHNIYYLVVNKLAPKNKGTKELIKSIKKEIEYKEGELTAKQRRFTL